MVRIGSLSCRGRAFAVVVDGNTHRKGPLLPMTYRCVSHPHGRELGAEDAQIAPRCVVPRKGFRAARL